MAMNLFFIFSGSIPNSNIIQVNIFIITYLQVMVNRRHKHHFPIMLTDQKLVYSNFEKVN